jgi:hypothetical protein
MAHSPYKYGMLIFVNGKARNGTDQLDPHRLAAQRVPTWLGKNSVNRSGETIERSPPILTAATGQLSRSACGLDLNMISCRLNGLQQPVRIFLNYEY